MKQTNVLTILRHANNLSIEDAAGIIDVSPQTWANWETRGFYGYMSNLEKIAKAFDMPMSTLVYLLMEADSDEIMKEVIPSDIMDKLVDFAYRKMTEAMEVVE